MFFGIVMLALVMSWISASLCAVLDGSFFAILFAYVGSGMATAFLLAGALWLREAISGDEKSPTLNLGTSTKNASA